MDYQLKSDLGRLLKSWEINIFIIQQSGNISPEEGFGIAIYHYIEGTKTFPPEFSSESKKQPIQRFLKKIIILKMI